VKSLELHLRGLRDSNRTALVTYFMGGLTPDWTSHVEAAVHAGADVIEIGIPFSDPLIDGGVIQEAALRALKVGTTFDSICADLERLESSIPLVAMTYFNVFHHYGIDRSAGRLESSGILGAIVPDLALEETSEWMAACDQHDVATIFLVAPSTPPERIRSVGTASQGFVYATGRMAVTGKSIGENHARRVVESLRSVTTLPTYIGIGITTDQQAREAAAVGDGVIVGSALVQIILDGGGPKEIERFVGSFRSALDD
jgi:tryptophan synthase alpha chain